MTLITFLELFIADRFISSLDVDNILKYLIIRLNQPYKVGKANFLRIYDIHLFTL